MKLHMLVPDFHVITICKNTTVSLEYRASGKIKNVGIIPHVRQLLWKNPLGAEGEDLK